MCVKCGVSGGESNDTAIIGFDQDIPEKTKKNIKKFSFLPFFVGVFLIFGYLVFVS